MDYKFMYRYWLESNIVDEKTKEELKEIENNQAEIEERFYKDLEFGTGGMRGILGAGTNRMNVYTVRKATQGLASYIEGLGEDAKKRGVVIGFDSRINSDVFAKEVAGVLIANGIKAFLFDSLRPVPVVSFTVRHLQAVAGIMVTASHNPPKYNGYKVYGEDGSQLDLDASAIVLSVIEKNDIFNDVKFMDYTGAQNSGLLTIIGNEINEAYYMEVMKQGINPEAIEVVKNDFKLVYTALHGSGNIPVREILRRSGFKNVSIVKEQELPDGTFKTVKSPNPEEREALALAMELAKKENADIVIGTDPDCDRIGVAVLNSQGEYIPLTGNMVGILLTEYILKSKAVAGTLPSNGVVIKTIVTSYLPDKICRAYKVEPINVLTGFKFIGQKIKDYEENNYYKQYLFGFEESYGYLAGTYCRDKDAVVSAKLVAEMAAYYKMQNKTLLDALDDIYEKYGYFCEKLMSLTFEGMDGIEKMKGMMKELRQNPPTEIAGIEVLAVNDILESTRKELKTGNTAKIDLPSSDVLRFELENENWLAARPSGTEPKIKFYVGAKGINKEDAIETADKIMNFVKEMFSK